MENTFEYLKEVEPEMRWHNNELIVFLYTFQIEDFAAALAKDGESVFDDEGLQVTLKPSYMVVDMAEICSYFGEDPEIILKRDTED